MIKIFIENERTKEAIKQFPDKVKILIAQYQERIWGLALQSAQWLKVVTARSKLGGVHLADGWVAEKSSGGSGAKGMYIVWVKNK
jgi:hypothetical protein